jgi:hypothetical protein
MFHLENGRLCVLTSRHRHSSIVVARAGIPEVLGQVLSIEPLDEESSRVLLRAAAPQLDTAGCEQILEVAAG